jgi:hypothetical protein
MLALGVIGMAGIAQAQDVLPARGTAIANEGKIGDRWMLSEGVPLATPQYPPHLASRGDDACLALGYQINEGGDTSNFAVLGQWSSAGGAEPVDGYWQAFAQAGADAVSQWRFQPRPEVDAVRPTYTVATLSFNSGQADAAALRAHCAISDLAATIQKAKSGEYTDSRERRDLERLNRRAEAGRTIPNPIQKSIDGSGRR